MSDGSIAIVGASCRFPGAHNLDQFWDLLISSRDAVSEIDSQRWSTRFYYHPDRNEPGKSYTWSAGLISGVDLFEPAFFGISPREAAQMDPQQRLLLELVWHAIENAGIAASQLSGTDTGVYIGAASSDYSDLRFDDPASADAYFMTGNTLSILANRISYIYDLHGPSLAVDTACSSSLVALHHACEALRGEQIACAVVGGINLLLAPYPFLGFCRASMLSRRGRCFAFDERADGYVRGEGGGVVILKPLAAALADGNPIHAVILGSGVNSDGRTIGLSLPSEAAQASLLNSVYARAGIAAGSLAFFEMHGTGTPAGDPIEAAAVGRALGQNRSTPLPIGSVKTNIGHLEPASGMAGLLKASLALEHGVAPPTLHCETPNPRIDFDALNLRLIRAPEPIAPTGLPAYAGVNSFGFGGTNAHVVLAAPAPRQQALRGQMPASAATMPPLLISARSEAALRELARSWRRTLTETPDEQLLPLLRAAARGRDHHPHRLVALGRDGSAKAGQLAEFLDNAATEAVVAGTAIAENRLAFVFSGNGAQFAAMGRDAMRSNAAFRAAVAEVDQVLSPQIGWSAAELLQHGVEAEQVARADFAQPLLFAIQVGIVRSLAEAGVTASGYCGHSVGEIAAAWAAGALSLADAGRVVVMRSRNQQRTRGSGRMAALALAPDAARDLLAELDSPAEIAALNTGHSLTISGPAGEILRLEDEARRRGLWFRALDLDFAFHSREMEAIREDLLTSLSGLGSSVPAARLVSTVTGAVVDREMLGAEHWWRNIRNPVRFAEAAGRLIGEGYRIFVEIGPTPVLQSYLRDALRAADAQGRVLGSLSRHPSGGDPFPLIAAHCHVAGHDLTQASGFDGPADLRGAPLYPWQRERFWFGKTVEAYDLVNVALDHPLLGFRRPDRTPCWFNHIDEQVLPWIADHSVDGMAVLPAAAILEMAFATARSQRPDAAVLEVHDVEVHRPLPFDKGRMRAIRTLLSAEDGDWQLASRPRLSSEPMTVHAVGHITAATDTRPILGWEEGSSDRSSIDGEELYRLAHEAGLDYGRRFRTVERVEIAGPDGAVAWLDSAAVGEPLDAYLIHPALLDGALQALIGLQARHRREMPGVSFLPWRFGLARLMAPFGRVPRTARLRLTRVGVRSVCADIALNDEAGAIVAEFADCWLRRVELTRRTSYEERALRVDLVPAPLREPGPTDIIERIAAGFSKLAKHHAANPDRHDRVRDDQAPLLDALVAAIGMRSLSRLVEPGRSFTIDELVADGQLAVASSELAEYLLRLLVPLGAATETGSEWRIEPVDDLPEISGIWRLLLAEGPDLVAELALAAAAAEDLPRILIEGPIEPHPRLSPMVEHVLRGSPASAAAIDLVCRALSAIAAAWPRDRKLRVLELGAQGRGASRRLLDCLARTETAFTYLATSVEAEQAAELSLLAESFVGAAARQWSPNDREDGLDPASFDIIIAVSASARLRLGARSLARLGDLLAPGGIFLGSEPEPTPFWDIILGQATGWWPAGERSPLRTGGEWHAELAAAGFAAGGSAAITAAPWPTAIFWGMAPPRPLPSPDEAIEPRLITLVGGERMFRAALEARLASAGHRVEPLQPPGFGVADDAGGGSGEAGGIILFLAEGANDDRQVELAAQQLAVLARLASEATQRQATLWVVTCDAQQTAPGEIERAAIGGALWGFARVLINEMPRLSVRLLDLASTVPPAERVRQIAREIAAAGTESEIVWTPIGRHVPRVRRGLPPHRATGPAELGLAANQPGGLESLDWEVRSPGPIGRNEVEIEVRAAGVNFRDLMWALGLLPEEALIDGFAGAAFGLECAGIVRSIGAAVEEVAVGDRVMAFAPAALSTRAVTIADAVTPIPAGISFAEAATIPVAFVTAIYALRHLAHLEPGEHVLIHAAAGGVGLAAIQYAKHCGAVVIATAGSEIKRAFLRLAGADHVFDSRDFSFAEKTQQITRGLGVDVVLNSLTGEAMERSLALLKPFGRFLELGKRDFFLNRRLHLRSLRQNVSYFAIDVDQLPLHRPDLARAVLAEITAALAAGSIRPLAHRVFAFGEVDEAFRLMQSSGHIGKLVLAPGDHAALHLRPPSEIAARRDGTYVVTGGIEGFGYEAARWLVAQGAGSIALVGRRGADTPGCEARVRALQAAGAEIHVYRGDVADRPALAAVLAEIRANQPPIRGVVHAASAIDDGLAGDVDRDRAAPILHPKLGGALALDALTREDPIELFVLFSSATTLLGAPGQGVYVAANTALEALARQRRAAGLPALAVAWGPIADAGYLAARPKTRDTLARRLGAKPIAAAQALASLPALIASGLPVAGMADANWSEARRFLPILATPPFSEIRTAAVLSPSEDSLAERLASLDAETAAALLTKVVCEEAAAILRLPASGIDPTRPLSQSGMDSLMAVELRLALEARLGIDLPLMSLAEGTSVASIVERLAAAAGPNNAEVTALTARHEAVDGAAFAVEPAEQAPSRYAAKPVAAE